MKDSSASQNATRWRSSVLLTFPSSPSNPAPPSEGVPSRVTSEGYLDISHAGRGGGGGSGVQSPPEDEERPPRDEDGRPRERERRLRDRHVRGDGGEHEDVERREDGVARDPEPLFTF